VAFGAFVAAFLALASVGAVSFQIPRSTETFAGIQAPAQFLNHWQQVGSESAVIPATFLRLWSGAVAAPSRLAHFSGMDRINAVTAGDMALVWVFNETAGFATSTEIEINFHIQYLAGVTFTTTSITVYIESQRAAPTGPFTYTVYWDSGHATGVTFVRQLEVAQVCSLVGTCP